MRLPLIGMLPIFRKQGGGRANPELDSDGRIRVSALQESPIVFQATAPADVSGKVIWNRDTAEGGQFIYEPNRSKWLSLQEFALNFGGDSEGNNNWRTATVNTVGNGGDRGYAGYAVPANLTITRVSVAARNYPASRDYRLLVNGVFPGGGLSGTITNGDLIENDVNYDLNAGDIVLVDGSTGGGVNDVELLMWGRWRG